ncbi:MAG: XdhC family protein [Anaerolineae bacterium]|nr:XdhC family protein [Anaerolineae bacterium]
MYDDFFAKAHELVQAGAAFVTAVVVRSEKPTSGKPGDKAIITADGVMHGWIGGSCAQPTVVKEALNALRADEARLIRLSTEPEAQEARDGLLDLPMTCFSGGTLEIYLEPQQPRPRLLVVGALPVAQALVTLGKAMNYQVIAVDVDGGGEALADADMVLTSLDEVVGQLRPYTYIVIATHGNYDELALTKILPAQPTYVGLVASPKRAEAVRDYLRMQGITETELLPLKAPAGLDIQARRGDEIALSIMAEIVQRRRSAELLDLALFKGETAVEATAVEATEDEGCSCGCGGESKSDEVIELAVLQPATAVPIALNTKVATAIDPICGMTVEITTAKYTFAHEGTTYYFCCAGCQATFQKSVIREP